MVGLFSFESPQGHHTKFLSLKFPMESVKDLIVDVSSTEVSIALMENHKLIELNKESSQGHSLSVGDVYLGKVKKILPETHGICHLHRD